MAELPRTPPRRERRLPLAWLLVLPVAVVAVGIPRLLGSDAAPPVATEIDGQRPNVLIVITDDQRADATITQRTMPATLRWFGEGGAVFPNAYAATPLCCPSRASMMTGLYAHNHGVVGNLWTQVQELDHDATIQRMLRDAGYRTAIFGKFFNHWPLRMNPPHFDRWATFFRGYEGARFNVQGDIRRVGYTTTYIGREATQFVRDSEEADDTPWLMYVSVFAPHGRATPEATYASADVGRWRGNPAVFERDRSDKPPYVREQDPAPFEHLAERATAERRTLLSVDDVVAELAATLRETGEGRDTLAIFVGDNGKVWGEHGLEQKRVPYMPSINVPLFVRWPGGGIARGAVDTRLAATADIAATALEAAGVPPPSELDARSLIDPAWERDALLLEHWSAGSERAKHPAPSWASLVSASSQYVEYYDGESPIGEPTFREYYDLDDDPWELENLLGDDDPANDPDVGALGERLRTYLTCHGTTGSSACP